MVKGDRVANKVLLQAGLEVMRQNGSPLTKIPSQGRSMLYKMQTGETVRVRTCNDHILIAVSDDPKEDARLNIEGTDWILLVMPEVERTQGKVIAYLLPTKVAVAEARRAHQKWLATNPNTSGNTTWNLGFRSGVPGEENNYFEIWAKHRLQGEISTEDLSTSQVPKTGEPGTINFEIQAAREHIAALAGVPTEAVKISIAFGL